MYLNWRKIKDCTPTKDRYIRRLHWKGRASDELIQNEEKPCYYARDTRKITLL